MSDAMRQYDELRRRLIERDREIERLKDENARLKDEALAQLNQRTKGGDDMQKWPVPNVPDKMPLQTERRECACRLKTRSR